MASEKKSKSETVSIKDKIDEIFFFKIDIYQFSESDTTGSLEEFINDGAISVRSWTSEDTKKNNNKIKARVLFSSSSSAISTRPSGNYKDNENVSE